MNLRRFEPTDMQQCASSGASPELAALMFKWATEMQRRSVPVLIYTVHRSNEAQRILYAQGRTAPGRIVTNAKSGQSAHNRQVGELPSSDAFDACPLIQNKPSWETKGEALTYWTEMGTVAEMLGLEWGRRFKSLGSDWAHFQYRR